MRKISFVLLFLFASLCLSVPVSHATETKSLWEMFPASQGDGGAYAYGYAPSRATPYRELEKFGDYSFKTSGQSFNIPFVTRDPDTYISFHPADTTQCGYIYGHEDAVFALTCPSYYTISLAGTFEITGGGSVLSYIKRNEDIIWSYTLSGYQSAVFDLSDLAFAQGDMLYFGISSNGADYNDSSRLFGSLSYAAAPEPVSSLLFLVGGAFMAVRQRRKTNKVS